jgi:polysaccharide export outer membrane protein
MMLCHARWSASLLIVLALSLWVHPPARAEDYTIGARDVLAITVWGQTDLSRDYTVAPDGFVPFPLIGRVKAAGLTANELAARLTELLAKDYLVNPQVILSVKEYLSQQVQVLGAAARPGIYYLTGPTTMLEILSRAGGLMATAGKQVILLRNPTVAAAGAAPASPILRFSLDKIQAGDPAENTRVLGQDTIIVSNAQSRLYFILGEIGRPGAYPLDRETNILEGIIIAGGFTNRAAPGRTTVIRSTPEGQKVIKVDMNDLLRRGREAKGVMLQESDVVIVPESFF